MDQPQIDPLTQRMLLLDWFAVLAGAEGLEMNHQSQGGTSFTLGDPKDFHVVAHVTEEPPYVEFVSSDPARQKSIDDVARRAAARVDSGDFGGVAWHSTELHEVSLELSPHSLIGPLLQRMGSQTRIAGWRRLGNYVLLEFVEELPEDWNEKQAILAPKAIVRVHIGTPAPRAGFLSARVAHGVIETVGAICTFALGRPVQLPHTVFPADQKNTPQLNQKRTDPAVLTLARKGVSLDIFNRLIGIAGLEGFQRTRSAFITFDAAVRQERDSVASVLYVVAAESLSVPNTNWRLRKLTKRFKEFFDELIPDALDGIVAHGNFEEAFGIRRGTRTARALRRELLDSIYAYRSGQLHEGLEPSYGGIGGFVEERVEAHRGLIADFVEAAILRYLEAPRVSLVGHPALDADGD